MVQSLSSLVRSILPRHRLLMIVVGFSTLVLIVALLFAQTLLGFGNHTQAAGGGGGPGSGGCAGVSAAICHFKGTSAQATFLYTSADGCTQINGQVMATEDASSMPPNQKVSGNTVFFDLAEYDVCDGTYLLAVDENASGVDFKADSLAQASVDATIEGEDQTGAPVQVTVHMTWQGIGGTTTTMDHTYFKSPQILSIYRYKAVGRDAIVTGTFTVGSTVISTPPGGDFGGGMDGSLFDVQDGSFQEEVTP